MPEFYTDNKTGDEILAVTYEELVPRFYKSVACLSTVVKRSESRGFGMRRVSRGHNTGKAMIEFDSLPIEIQQQLFDPRKEQHPLEMFYKWNVEAERYYRTYTLDDGRRIAPEIQKKYTMNASTIDAVLALKQAREESFARCGKKVKDIWGEMLREAQSFRDVQQKKYEMAHNLPDNVRRFSEKVNEYRNAADAYGTLISGKHISSSVSGARKVNEQMLNLFESLFTGLGYKPNYVDVYMEYSEFLAGRKEIVSNATGEVLNPADYTEVSEATIRNYLARWESKAATLRLRTGDRQKLMGETKPYHSMEIPKYAGSLLSIDDRQPPFEYAKGMRVWFYLGYDLGADCYTTIVWGKDKQGIMLDFYRQMVRNYAEWGLPLPAELECESNLNASYKDTFLRSGNMFEYVRIEANNARGKKIENRNRAMRYGDERKSEGWIARPFAVSESNRAGNDKVQMLPFETIVEQTLQRYEKWNNAPHPQLKEMSRWEFFMTHQHPNLKPINWQGIIPFLGYKIKSSCHTGIVRLNKGECLLGMNGQIATGDELISYMKLIEGEDIVVRWLDGNDGRVLKAYAYIGEQFVCELIQKPTYARARIEQTEADFSARELMCEYVATVEGYGNRRKKAIEKITVIEQPEVSEESEYTFSIPELHKTEKKQQLEPAIIEDYVDDFNTVLTDVDRSFKHRLADTF